MVNLADYQFHDYYLMSLLMSPNWTETNLDQMLSYLQLKFLNKLIHFEVVAS